MSVTEASVYAMSDPSIFARVNEKMTSSAVKGSPPANFAPGRRWKRHTVGEGCSQLVASAGTNSSFGPRPTSGS